MTEWTLNLDDLDRIALGAGILGTGGGGNPYLAKLEARAALRAGQQIRVIRPEDLEDDAMVLAIGGIGSPTVGIEKMSEGHEGQRLIEAIEMVTGRKVDALVADEIGGGNGFAPMIPAAQLGLPVVDADGMGRAFPETQMTSFFIGGQETAPAAITDSAGNVAVVTSALSPEHLETLMRAHTIAMGCTAMMSTAPMSGAFIKQHAIQHSISLAHSIGGVVMEARANKSDPVEAALKAGRGRLLLHGKITDIARQIAGGFTRGNMTVTGMGQDKGREVLVDIQNEFIVAREDEALCAAVPDLISVVETETGNPITTESLRYGMRISVLLLPAPGPLRSDKALSVVGPRAFGYDFEYSPVAAPYDPPLSPHYSSVAA